MLLDSASAADKVWYAIVDTIDPITGGVLFALALVLGIVLRIWLKRRSKPKKTDETPLYVREVPEGWTAGEMCPLFYYFDKKKIYVDESISATILDLARRGYLEITDEDPDDDKLARIKIVKLDKQGLKTHEGIILNLLECVAAKRESFRMEDFDSYIKSHEQFVSDQIKAYREACEKKAKDEGCYDAKDKARKIIEKIAVACSLIGIVGFVADYLYLEWGLFLWTEISLFVLGLALGFASSVPSKLSEKGERLYFEFHAMEQFLKDFSALDEHSIPALALWDEYMVFATAMGIAETVSKNMQVKYPEALTEEERKARASSVGAVTASAVGGIFSNPVMTLMFASALNRSVRGLTRTLSETTLKNLARGAGFIGGSAQGQNVLCSVFKAINRGIRPGGGKPPWRR